MKMSKGLLAEIETVFNMHKGLIEEHKQALINQARYKSLRVRLAFDCYYALAPKEVKEKVRVEDLDDSHLETGIVKALENVIGKVE